MAEFRALDESIFHVSVPSADLDVVDGYVDLSDVDDDVRVRVERELAYSDAFEREGEFAAEEVVEDSDESIDDESADEAADDSAAFTWPAGEDD